MQKLKKTISKVAKLVKNAGKKAVPSKKAAKPKMQPAKKADAKKVATKPAAQKVVAHKGGAKPGKKDLAKQATAAKPAAKASGPIKAGVGKAGSSTKTPDSAKASSAKTPEKQPKAFKESDKKVEKQAAEKVKKSVEKAPVQAAVEEPEVEEVILTDAEGRRYCRTKECDQPGLVDGYCRYHYLLHWKKIQVRKKILTEGKLERYIEDLTSRYPTKFVEILKKDLRTEKDFLAAIQELEIDESANDGEFEEETQTYIDEVRGVSSSSPGSDDSRTDDDY